MGTTVNEIELRELAYRYDYDSKGRLVVKRLPVVSRFTWCMTGKTGS